MDIESVDDNDEADVPTIVEVGGDDANGIAHVCTMRSMAKSAESTLSLVALFNSDSAIISTQLAHPHSKIESN